MKQFFKAYQHWAGYLILICAISLHSAETRPKSGIPEIDSLPLHDWKVKNPPLSTVKALSLAAFLPGGGQFYGHHPVRGGFLLGLESALFGLSLSTYFVALPKWNADISRFLDSADAAFVRMGDPDQFTLAKAEFTRWNLLARDRAALRERQADLANSELGWALGLHFYGMLDALEIVRQSQIDDLPIRSVRRAMWMGLAFPGGAQFYNGRYGKFGLLWMGLSAAALSAWSRQNIVESLNRQIATARVEKALGVLDTPLEELERDRTLYRKRRNQYYWGMTLFYLYSVLDGMVDASLSDFDKPNRYAITPGTLPFSAELAISF